MHAKKIYKLINSDNTKIYIGKTTQSLENRLAEHIRTAKRWAKDELLHKKHPYKSRLYPAMNTHGYDKFRIELLEDITENVSLEEREQYWIATLNTLDDTIGYNISPGGCGGPLFSGHTHTDLAKAKISAAFKGKKQTKEISAKRHKKLWTIYQSLSDSNIYTIQEILPATRSKYKAPQTANFKNYKVWKYAGIYYISLGPERDRLPALSFSECQKLNKELIDIGFVTYKQYTKYKYKSKEEKAIFMQNIGKAKQKKYWEAIITQNNIDIELYKQNYFKYKNECPNKHLELLFKLPYNMIRGLNNYLGLFGGKSGHKNGKVTL